MTPLGRIWILFTMKAMKSMKNRGKILFMLFMLFMVAPSWLGPYPFATRGDDRVNFSHTL